MPSARAFVITVALAASPLLARAQDAVPGPPTARPQTTYAAPSAVGAGANASGVVGDSRQPAVVEAGTPGVETKLITNGPVPDTRENRARYGGPDSRGGRRTAPAGN